ncbi:MAG: DEAD/DEAH box helicase [Bacteroidales bacterium]|nr:DEAD/DEAH box helicase [Bacteroidales bacterium]
MTTEEITRRVKAISGIESLNPMQQQMGGVAIPGKFLLLSPTGSGKTLAFTIVVLRAIPKADGKLHTVIIAPTRELVLQIFDVIRPLAAPDYKTVALYGGHNVETETNSLRAGADIVVATPGRLLDHIHRGHLSLKYCSTLVLDEYDKALDLGFHDQLRDIVRNTGSLRTLILTSATSATEIPQFIDTKGIETFDFSDGISAAVPDIEVFKVESPARDKLDTLEALLRDLQGKRAIVFVNHREAADRVYQALKRSGFGVALYHGGLEQADREKALILFENGSANILVSTDLAARGLDIADVEAVIHYHLPTSPEAYTHRNGRTGRAGARGKAYVIVSEADNQPDYITDLEVFEPAGKENPTKPAMATLFINAGKKEKISKGDIAGFLIQKGGLTKDEVGRIIVKDHCAYVAVPAGKAREVAVAVAPHKLKNTRVRVTQLKM